MQAASGVDEHDVNTLVYTSCDGIEGHGSRVCAFLAANSGSADSAAPSLQLVCGRCTEGIGSTEQHVVSHGDEYAGELTGRGGLASAVDTDHHDDSRLALVRHSLDGAVHFWVAHLNESFAQHGACFLFGAHAAFRNLVTQ